MLVAFSRTEFAFRFRLSRHQVLITIPVSTGGYPGFPGCADGHLLAPERSIHPYGILRGPLSRERSPEFTVRPAWNSTPTGRVAVILRWPAPAWEMISRMA